MNGSLFAAEKRLSTVISRFLTVCASRTAACIVRCSGEINPEASSLCSMGVRSLRAGDRAAC
jgi:hypothetical protein